MKRTYYFQRSSGLLFILLAFLLSLAYASPAGQDARTPSLQPQEENNPHNSIQLKKSFGSTAVDVAIIESQSFNSGHVVDTVWAHTAKSLGYSNAIFNQSFLDKLDSLSTGSVLVVSSGIGDISDSRKEGILNFVRRGGNVYLQAEYLPTYQTNIAFGAIVDSLGGQFVYDSTLTGQLVPMYVNGILQSNYNQVDSLNYFWYGCRGLGDTTIVPFLRYGSQYFGFIFTPPNPQFGKVLTTSDQDWVNQRAGDDLMENILKYLFDTATSIGDDPHNLSVKSFVLKQNYPNPFNPKTVISYDLKNRGHVRLRVFDVMGREVKTLVNSIQNAGMYSVQFDASSLSSGLYYYTLSMASGQVQSRKMVVIK